VRSDEHPTGRTRYRVEKRWLKPYVLVLQIEVRFGDGPPDHDGMPVYLRGSCWRDAQPEDLALVLPDAQTTPQPTVRGA
jgi:hypothetical protein